MTESIKDMLIRHEGIRFKPYQDTLGYWTIGIGRCISTKGITKDEAMFLFFNDLEECIRDLANNIFQGRFYTFPEPVQKVLINMRFQLGHDGLLGFRKMIMAAKNNDWPEMALQMKDSKWYNQTTRRAEELIEIVRSEIK